MKRIIYSVLGFIFLILGFAYLLNSITGITGFIIIEEINKPQSTIMSISFFTLGLAFLSFARKKKALFAVEYLVVEVGIIIAAIIGLLVFMGFSQQTLTLSPTIPAQPTFPAIPAPIEGTLFDIASNLIKSEIIFGEKLATKISLVNFGVPGKVNVTLDYIISDLENNIILTQQERLDVETQLEFIKTFELPSDIKAGEYKLTIKLTYLGQKEEAVSQNQFQIIPRKEKPFWIIAAIVVSIIIVVFIILWKIRLKKVRNAEINRLKLLIAKKSRLQTKKSRLQQTN